MSRRRVDLGRQVGLAMAIAADGRYLYVIAAESRISPSLLADFVRGYQRPSPEQTERLAAVLKSTPEELFGPADSVSA